MNAKMQDRTDFMLDQALEMTFPASDPITIYLPQHPDVKQTLPASRAPA